jgi:hypothetical protein
LIFLPYAYEIFFKTPFSTCLWLESVYFDKVFLEWSHEIIDILTYEYLEDKVTSLHEKYFCYIKDGEIEFY